MNVNHGFLSALKKWCKLLDGQASDPVLVLSGVPQGSVNLGPVHFLIFINDLTDNIRSSVQFLADDCVNVFCTEILNPHRLGDLTG